MDPEADDDKDGVKNKYDVFPHDPNEWLDNDKDGIGDNSDHDRDGDGVPNDKDVFPDNRYEWKDSDGDGIGDNADAYPFDSRCYSATLPCPKKAQDKDSSVEKDAHSPAPQEPEQKPPQKPLDPVKLGMSPRHLNKGLPPQGYDEYHPGVKVKHGNDTHTSDWRGEWPRNRETEAESIRRICAQHPDNKWCQRFKVSGSFSR